MSILRNRMNASRSICKFVCICVFFFSFFYISSFMFVTILSHAGWLQSLLVLLGIHSLEYEMCLHFEHVTNYLLRLTLRDLAEAFTLLRCCLGQTYFRGLLFQFDCLYPTGVSLSQM